MKSLPEFLIGAWEGPRKFVMNTPEESRSRYREMRECGINTLFLFAELSDDEWLKLSLDAAADVGLRLVIDLGACWKDKDKLKKAVEKTAGCPAVVAYNVVDEPPVGWLDEVGEALGYVKSVCGGKPVFTNLNPLYAPPAYLPAEGGGMTPYQNYLAEAERKVRPDMLSFDYYPYVGDGAANEKMKLGLLRNLTDARIAATRMDVPLCGFLQSSRWGRYETGEWRGTVIPGESRYRFLYGIHLAFGASMLTNFLYWSRTGTRSEQRVPGVFDGIMTEDGERTQVYGYVQRINSELSGIGGELAECDFKGLLAKGLTGDETDAVKPLLLDDFHGFSFDAKGKILAGCFENGDTYSVLCVNMSDECPAGIIVGNAGYFLPAGGAQYLKYQRQ